MKRQVTIHLEEPLVIQLQAKSIGQQRTFSQMCEILLNEALKGGKNETTNTNN